MPQFADIITVLIICIVSVVALAVGEILLGLAGLLFTSSLMISAMAQRYHYLRLASVCSWYLGFPAAGCILLAFILSMR